MNVAGLVERLVLARKPNRGSMIVADLHFPAFRRKGVLSEKKFNRCPRIYRYGGMNVGRSFLPCITTMKQLNKKHLKISLKHTLEIIAAILGIVVELVNVGHMALQDPSPPPSWCQPVIIVHDHAASDDPVCR